MSRAMRRQLRAWKQEFLAAWGHLRSFHRVSLGIILAAIAMMAAKNYVFASLKIEINKQREWLEKEEAPELIMEPDKDPDLQELHLRIENLEEVMPRCRQQKQEAIAAWPDFSAARKGAILAKFDDLILQAGLTKEKFHDSAVDLSMPEDEPTKRGSRNARAADRRRSSSRRSATKADKSNNDKKKDATDADKTPPKNNSALRTAVQTYVLTGSFEAVCDFLNKLVDFGYPARLENIHIQLNETPDGGSASVQLQPNKTPELKLSFHLKLYSHD